MKPWAFDQKKFKEKKLKDKSKNKKNFAVEWTYENKEVSKYNFLQRFLSNFRQKYATKKAAMQAIQNWEKDTGHFCSKKDGWTAKLIDLRKEK